MTFPKMFAWLARFLFSLVLAAGATLLRAAPEPPDPITGNWLYYKDISVTFNADGTADWKGKNRLHGTWEYLHNPQVQRHYRIVWEQGKSIDDLVLAEDGQHAHVRNAMGEHAQYDVRRAIPDKPVAANAPPAPATPSVSGGVDPTDPVIGNWLWRHDHPATFHADGTVVADAMTGTWQALPSSGGERKYQVNLTTRVGKKYIDKFVWKPELQTAEAVNQEGERFEIRRAPLGPAAASPAASVNPFGVPTR